MKKKVIKLAMILSISCVGFVLGYCVKEYLATDVNAADNNETLISQGELFADIFSGDAYSCTYNQDTKVYRFVYNETKARSNDFAEKYTKNDALSMAKKMLNTKYDMVVFDETDSNILYEERQGDYPTGGYVSFVYGKDGYLLEACYREGVVFDVEAGKMISFERAYQLAVDAVREEYGDKFDLYCDIDDCAYEFYYSPPVDKVCYLISGINGNTETEKDLITFCVTVSVDGETVSVGRSK